MEATASGSVSDAPSEGGEGDSSLRSSNKGGGSGRSYSANNTVGSGNESAPTSSSSQDGGKDTGGSREGKSAHPSSPAPSYTTSTSDSGEGVAQPVLSERDICNLEWIEEFPELTVGRTRGETGTGALLTKLESVRKEMYASNVDNVPSPRESEFGFRSPIGLHVGQAECIPQNWADIQKSEFYKEWLSGIRLELEGHNEIGMFSADVVHKGVNVITAKCVFVWKIDSDSCITKA